MRFALTNDVFDDSRATLDHLDRLLLRVVEEVHSIELVDAEYVEGTAWFAGQRSHRKELVRRTVVATAFAPTARRVHVGVNLSLPAAVQLAYTPLLVAVENRDSDGMVVDVAIGAYGTLETRRLWQASPTTGPAADFDHGGGTGDLLKHIRRVIDRAETSGVPPRLVVVTDGDTRWPGDRSAKAVQIAATCAAAHVPCVILSSRAAENYIPDAAMQRWADEPNNANARPQVAALLRLTPDQRDHFPMKGRSKGIPAVDRADALAAQQQLFADVCAEDRSVLIGFHDHIVRLLRDHLPPPGTEELDQRDRRGDLRRLVLLIEAEL